ncbi:hypothetical protein [Rufibacter sp. XAAS-G3-1]|uniref:hypothetical protein n=1 Tax=Rufibacter sp. XAAS-G3-1 TaxID=2729134 RepID=UPI0015E79EDF|nr:hypothetical protein [Rufibacter sp. XAAS-G3-1]
MTRRRGIDAALEQERTQNACKPTDSRNAFSARFSENGSKTEKRNLTKLRQVVLGLFPVKQVKNRNKKSAGFAENKFATTTAKRQPSADGLRRRLHQSVGRN